MATVPACDVCGRVSPVNVVPPIVEPCRWQTAVADYVGTLCNQCAETKTLSEIIACFEAGPGGTVDGKARGPYMIRREDEEAPASQQGDGGDS